MPGVVTRVIDGDTLEADLDLGWGVWLRGEHIRLSGVNCPERDTAAGLQARDFTQAQIDAAGGIIMVHSKKREKYGRVLAVVHLPVADDLTLTYRDLGALLLAQGHAVAM